VPVGSAECRFEGIRQDNRPLPREQQEAYTKTVESTYRKLADLLLSQGRLLEAQQVLELLKIQEIDFVDREIHATLTSSGIEYTPTETEIKCNTAVWLPWVKRFTIAKRKQNPVISVSSASGKPSGNNYSNNGSKL
jgi:hypothetical protein